MDRNVEEISWFIQPHPTSTPPVYLVRLHWPEKEWKGMGFTTLTLRDTRLVLNEWKGLDSLSDGNMQAPQRLWVIPKKCKSKALLEHDQNEQASLPKIASVPNTAQCGHKMWYNKGCHWKIKNIRFLDLKIDQINTQINYIKKGFVSRLLFICLILVLYKLEVVC